MPWVVYLLRSGKHTYVGCTTDVERRLRQHNGELSGGARRTRAHRPWELVKTAGPYENRSEAQSAEYKAKRNREFRNV